LPPASDLRRELERAADALPGRSGFVLSGIGSLTQASLRLAAAESATLLAGPLEVLSLAGSVTPQGAHLHASVSTAEGRVLGGHLGYGCVVGTTAEVLLATLPEWQLSRQHDPVSGYNELAVAAAADMARETRLRRFIQGLLIVLAGCLALSAVPGGITLLAGFYAPPVEQLKGSAFTDFTVPGLALLFLVGGSAVLAAGLLLRRNRSGPLAALLAGTMVMCFEFVEVLAIGSPPGPAHVMQLLYFGIGLALVGASLIALFIELRGAGDTGHAKRDSRPPSPHA
jgi:hypothetical protein